MVWWICLLELRRGVHIAFSTLVALSLIFPDVMAKGYWVFLTPSFALFLVMLYYGSLLPDVDAGSRGNVVLRVTSLAIYTPIKYMSRMFGGAAGRHRGFMHTLMGLAFSTAFWFAVFLAPCFLLGRYAPYFTQACGLFTPKVLLGIEVPRIYMPATTATLGIASGYLLHLLGDSYTYMGIRVLFVVRLRGKLRNGVSDHYPVLVYGLMAVITCLALLDRLSQVKPILLAELSLMSLVIWIAGRS